MKCKVVALVIMSALLLMSFVSRNWVLFKVNPSLLQADEHQQQPLGKPLPSAFKLQPVRKLPPSAFKHLPEDSYMTNFSHSGIRMFQSSQCKCDPEKGLTVYKLQDVFRPEEIKSVKQRRKKEFEQYKKRYKSFPGDVLIAKPNSPLSYPVYGVELLPLATILLPGITLYGLQDTPLMCTIYPGSWWNRCSVQMGLGIHAQNGELFEVSLEGAQGTFSTLADVSDSVFHGRGTTKVTITSSSVELVNFILQHTTYTSVVYHVHTVDTVTFTMGPHVAKFPVVIRQPTMPWLYDPGEEWNINSLVTITTKTFLRYESLRILIRSIRKYYPNLTIIVADDNEESEKIQEPNVEQYFMPFAKGWFAGRNLAVSQVTTKYFLWVDDDFVFTEKTNIEKMVDVLENTNLDLVGGSVGGNMFNFKLLYEEGDEDGDCVQWSGGYYGAIDGFPNCVLTGGVVNFFLAHTLRVQRVGFDPKLARVAHTEFFIDGLGSLLVGSCPDIVVGHQKKKDPVEPSQVKNMERYSTFRANTQNQVTFKLKLHYFKNRLKCFTKR